MSKVCKEKIEIFQEDKTSEIIDLDHIQTVRNFYLSRWACWKVCVMRKWNHSKPLKSVFRRMGICLTPLIVKINFYTSRWAHRKIYVVQNQNCSKLLKIVLVSIHAFGTIGCFLKQTTMFFFMILCICFLNWYWFYQREPL